MTEELKYLDVLPLRNLLVVIMIRTTITTILPAIYCLFQENSLELDSIVSLLLIVGLFAASKLSQKFSEMYSLYYYPENC